MARSCRDSTRPPIASTYEHRGRLSSQLHMTRAIHSAAPQAAPSFASSVGLTGDWQRKSDWLEHSRPADSTDPTRHGLVDSCAMVSDDVSEPPRTIFNSSAGHKWKVWSNSYILRIMTTVKRVYKNFTRTLNAWLNDLLYTCHFL